MTDKTWDEYAEAGAERAHALGNRGPVRLDDDGHLIPEILDAYQLCQMAKPTSTVDHHLLVAISPRSRI